MLIRQLKIIFGYIISLIIVIIVCIIVIELLIWKNEMITDEETWNDSIIFSQIPSILNVAQIIIFNIVFNEIARLMTIYENPKHFTQYEDSLASKIL